MTTEEHLNKIKEKCCELLAIAEKRTPGIWKHNEGRRMRISVDSIHEDAILHGDEFEVYDCDADFIASCAGPAEAGWRATIAAIDWIVSIRSNEGPKGTYEMLNNILSAWPVELL